MEKINVKYRTWFKGIAPRPIKLEIPGWAGEPNAHTDGDKPQPWHCPPFVEGSTYGLEICYPFDTECHIKMVGENIVFEGDFREENKNCPEVQLPPFLSFAPSHFGTTSSVDIRVPDGYILRLEPHPRFYTDTTGTVPCCLAGHIQTDWWPRIFFMVFKNPFPGQTIIFRKGDPIAQALILPKKISYNIQEMSEEEKNRRLKTDSKIDQLIKKYAKNEWKDHRGHSFSDKYKQLSKIAAKGGEKAVNDFLNQLQYDDLQVKLPKKQFKRKLLRKTV